MPASSPYPPKKEGWYLSQWIQWQVVSGKNNRIAVLSHQSMLSGGTQSSVYACLTDSGTIWMKIREKGPSLGQHFSFQVLVTYQWRVTSWLKLRLFFSLLSLMTPFRITAMEWLDQVARLSSQYFGLSQAHLPFHLPFCLSGYVFIGVTRKNLCFYVNISSSVC